MSSRELNNLVDAGLLKREPRDRREFEGLVSSGRKRLVDVRNSTLSAESKFDLAYGAAHAFALAGLRWHGYRPANKRYIVFQALQHTLGMRPEIWRILAKCHGLRNSFEYEGTFDVDRQLLEDLMAATEALEAAIKTLDPAG
jgi:hypothetical protein